jgi:hypothetical protein
MSPALAVKGLGRSRCGMVVALLIVCFFRDWRRVQVICGSSLPICLRSVEFAGCRNCGAAAARLGFVYDRARTAGHAVSAHVSHEPSRATSPLVTNFSVQVSHVPSSFCPRLLFSVVFSFGEDSIAVALSTSPNIA